MCGSHVLQLVAKVHKSTVLLYIRVYCTPLSYRAIPNVHFSCTFLAFWINLANMNILQVLDEVIGFPVKQIQLYGTLKQQHTHTQTTNTASALM